MSRFNLFSRYPLVRLLIMSSLQLTSAMLIVRSGGVYLVLETGGKGSKVLEVASVLEIKRSRSRTDQTLLSHLLLLSEHPVEGQQSTSQWQRGGNITQGGM